MIPLNSNLTRLFDIARKDERTGIGLMSGTSLDGQDIALCRFSGKGLDTSFKLLNFITVPYEEAFKTDVLQVFARKATNLEKLCLLNEKTGLLHAELVLRALNDWKVNPDKVDFIASHGQTIYHAPKRLHRLKDYPNGTLQIGDGDHIATATGILTISDFRQKHIAAGGEGAPLALYGDVVLGSKAGENRILLNIGGIANLTYLPGDNDLSKAVCTDIGPGNTLIDAACREYFGKPYDEDSEIALSGRVDEKLLTELLKHPFFSEKAPKTTGPELFNLALVQAVLTPASKSKPENMIATLSELTARAIAGFIKGSFSTPYKIFTSGGGARNPFVMKRLQELLNADITGTDAIGIDPDAKEAILFALLGNEALCGEPLKIGDNPAVLMGKLSFPA